MKSYRSRTALLLLALIPLLHSTLSAESERRFRMYRNPAKARLVILPVESRRLERPAKQMFNQAMEKEARKLKDFQLVAWPEEVPLDSLGQMPPGALTLLNEKYKIDLVLQSKLEHAPERNVLFAEVIDTRNGDIRADFRQECQCPVGELIFWMVPESLKRLTTAPRLKALRCGPGMAAIPAPVSPGSREPDSAGTSWGPGAFCMDMYEYPNESAGEPVVEKTWSEAESLCGKQGKRLCTEGEWELACGGWKQTAFPYGTSYDNGQCNTQSQTIQLSGGNPGCKSPFGVYDLSGNVYEWTASNWSSKYEEKVVKGGNWNSGAENSGCKARFGQSAVTGSTAIGFRCCLTLTR